MKASLGRVESVGTGLAAVVDPAVPVRDVDPFRPGAERFGGRVVHPIDEGRDRDLEVRGAEARGGETFLECPGL